MSSGGEGRGVVRYVRLTPDLIGRLNEHRRGWPKRDQWCAFCRQEKGYEGPFERQYPALKRRDPVTPIVARGLIDYLRERRGWNDITLGQHSEPADSLVPDRGEGVWDTWQTVVAAVADRFEDCDEMYFHNPYRDSVVAAHMVARTVGLLNAMPGESLGDSDCEARGERHMGRSVETYARWLLAMSRREIRSVMFVVAPVRAGPPKQYVPIGATVVLPLKEDVFRRFCAGVIADGELTPDDMQQPSRHILVDAIAEPPASVGISLEEVTAAQAHCVLYQVAYFTRGLRPRRPCVVTFGGAPKYIERMRRQGYRDMGTCMPGSDKPIMLLAHPADGGKRALRSFASYNLLKLSLGLYQLANKRQWRKEDGLSAGGH
jgi:hypothetical protein